MAGADHDIHNEDQYPVYQNDDLGLIYSTAASTFRVWSPQAEEAQVLMFETGIGGYPKEAYALTRSESGTWCLTIEQDLAGWFYTYRVKINGHWSIDVPDPYAKMVGVNGLRAMIGDINSSNPPGWHEDISPSFSKLNRPEDAIIYELHIRDASIHPGSGISLKGKYSGLTETGTRNKDGLATGIDHLKELGVTHIHLLPLNDFNSVDETDLHTAQYNWGYDPLNYFTPEGSYSTDPYDGITRIRELKSMIATMHKHGLRVVVDVVFNHTAHIKKSIFNQLAPGYYYRHNPDGSFSDGTGCGNEVASEMPMARKFMIDCLVYWLKEYHVDGFRFDLMGVHDIETMQIIADTLRSIKTDILLYGEGWAGGHSIFPHEQRAVKENVQLLHGIAVFSDDIRDGIKGRVFMPDQKGFIGGASHLTETIKAGIVASCDHPQVNYANSDIPGKAFATRPGQVVSYCECHDNHTLWDKLALSNSEDNVEDRKMMHKLALSIILTSQGIPFLHAGTEFLRSKKGVENSYKSPDDINAIDWNQKTQHVDYVEYIKRLIRIRKEHPAFRMTRADEITRFILFDKETPEGCIVYQIDGEGMHDHWKKIWIGINQRKDGLTIPLPAGKWKDAFSDDENNILKNSFTIPGICLSMLYRID